MKSTLINFYSRFDFCQAKGDEKAPPENLGQVVFGDRINASPYKLSFLKNEECVSVCEKSYNRDNIPDKKKLSFIARSILFNYQHHWIIDNLPVVWCYISESGDRFCSRGFPVGCLVTLKGEKKDACKIFVNFKLNFSHE